MLRITAPLLILCAAAACAPRIPDSSPEAGVGFGDYNSYRSAETAPASPDPARGEAGEIAASTLEALGAPGAEPSAETATADPAAVTPGRPRGLSDEQDFEAVASRETIESDAERLARQRAAYELVEPEPVPDRAQVDAPPNIVEYALSTGHVVGQSLYRRGLFASERRAARKCAEFVTDDLAQEAFLANGGPERDRLGVDPDGDGFACGWDPAPFRRVAAAAAGQ